MKRKILIFTVPLLLLMGTFYSCKKEPNLKDTKWKLAGIINTQTGELKELEPINCEDCYTLTFDTNTRARGISMINMVHRSNEFICATRNR